MIPARIPAVVPPGDPVARGRALRAVANQQDGIVSRAQLRAIGMTPAMIERAVLLGRMRAVHHGIYCVGHDRLTPRAAWIAALLAVGPGGVLSHRTAAAARGILPWRRGPVDITCPRRIRARSGMRIHHSALPAPTWTTIDGLPCTSIARTVVDLAALGPEEMTRRAWGTAASRRLLVLREIERELAARRGRPGAPTVRRLLREHAETLVQRTRSEVERDALRLIASTGLPAPIANALLWIGDRPLEVDLLWPQARLAVEVDPWSTHGNELAHRNDARRDVDLQLAGWRPARLTEADLAAPALTGERLAELLALGPPPVPGGRVAATFTPVMQDNVTPTKRPTPARPSM